MERLSIGKTTIVNPESVEYKWIRTLTHDGVEPRKINESIQNCLGGDETSADIMRKIALGESTPNKLLNYLGFEL